MEKKGYWLAMVDITDPENYPRYVAANKAAFDKYGATFLVRGGRLEAVEGVARPRNIVIEFADYDTALACWKSPEYQRAKARRDGAVEIDLIVIEGYEG